MATIQQNSINFTNILADPIYQAAGKFSRSANNDGTGRFDTTLTENEITKSFNAIEIDWNGATPGIGEGTNGIQTTGELLSLIKAIHTSL